MVGDFTFGRLNSAASLTATRQKRGHHRIEIRPNWFRLPKKSALVIRYARRFNLRMPMPDNVMEFLNSKPEGPHKFATILADKTRQLLALDRYERRALSRPQIYRSSV